VIKYFWQTGGDKSITLSKMPAALIKLGEGVFLPVGLMGKQKVKNGPVLTRAIVPTYPVLPTGNILLLDEVKLQNWARIIYLKTSFQELAKIHLSIGLSGPDELEFKES